MAKVGTYYSKEVYDMLQDPKARFLFGSSSGGSITLTTTGTSGAATLVGTTLNIPQYAGAVSSLTTTGTSGAATLTSGVLNIPTPPAATFTSLTTTGTSGASTLTSGVLNIPTPPSATFTSLTTTGTSGASTLAAGVLNVPNYADTSIYSTNGTLAGARIVTMNGNALTLTSNAAASLVIQSTTNTTSPLLQLINDQANALQMFIGGSSTGGLSNAITIQGNGSVQFNISALGNQALVFQVNGSEAARFFSANRHLSIGAATDDGVGVLQVAGNVTMKTAGSRLFITEGSNSPVGQTTLVLGTKAITITGITTASRAFVTLVSQGGTITTTVSYAAVCTSNTLTITALTSSGTTDTTDTSILNYFVIN